MTRVIIIAALLLGGPALAQHSDQLSSMDAAVASATTKAARSVVQIQVDRTNYGPRPLSMLERRGLGVTGAYDQRYFVRPDGPATGVVIAPGLVATFDWNIEGEGTLTVIAPDGSKHAATRAGRDENLKVTLLKVPGLTAPPIPRTTRSPRVGQTLLLVGRSDSNRSVVTRGILSGLGRHRGDAFTHSARTSYGNVGGALVDLRGNLVGLSVRHQAKSRQGQASGVGFAALASHLTPNLQAMAAGKVIPGRPTAFLGISSDVRFGGPGVKIMRIVENTAAKRIGLKVGDQIKIFNSVELMDFNHLLEEILKLEVGAQIVITVVRGEKEMDFTVKLGQRPKDAR